MKREEFSRQSSTYSIPAHYWWSGTFRWITGSRPAVLVGGLQQGLLGTMHDIPITNNCVLSSFSCRISGGFQPMTVAELFQAMSQVLGVFGLRLVLAFGSEGRMKLRVPVFGQGVESLQGFVNSQ